MSKSSPADLAVAFRSLPRRLREAGDDTTTPEDRASASAVVHELIDAAATLLECDASPQVVGATIDDRRPRDWEEADLEQLREIAKQAASAIRQLDLA